MLWNYTVRYVKLFKYYWNNEHISKWSSYYYPYPKPWNHKQLDKIEADLRKAFLEFEWFVHNDPFNHIPLKKKKLPKNNLKF